MSVTALLIIFFVILITVRVMSKFIGQSSSYNHDSLSKEEFNKMVSHEEMRLRQSNQLSTSSLQDKKNHGHGASRYLQFLKEQNSKDLLELNRELEWGETRFFSRIEKKLLDLKIKTNPLKVHEILILIFKSKELSQFFFSKRVDTIKSFEEWIISFIFVEELLKTECFEYSRLKKIRSKALSLFIYSSKEKRLSFTHTEHLKKAPKSIAEIKFNDLNQFMCSSVNDLKRRIAVMIKFSHAIVRLDRSDLKDLKKEIEEKNIKNVLRAFHPDSFSEFHLSQEELKIANENFSFVRQI